MTEAHRPDTEQISALAGGDSRRHRRRRRTASRLRIPARHRQSARHHADRPCASKLLRLAAAGIRRFLVDAMVAHAPGHGRRSPHRLRPDRSPGVTPRRDQSLPRHYGIRDCSDRRAAAIAAPAPASRAAEAAESGVELDLSADAAVPSEAPAVEVVNAAESTPGKTVDADGALIEDLDQDDDAPDATIATAAPEYIAPTSSAPGGAIPLLSVTPDPGSEFDPVWLTALAAGGLLLVAAGFAYVFRPR